MKRKLLIEVEGRIHYGCALTPGVPSKAVQSASLEGLFAKLAPEAPAEYVTHTAEVVAGILGQPGEDEDGFIRHGVVTT